MDISDWLNKDTACVKVIQYDRLFIRFLSAQESQGGVYITC